MTRIFSSLRFRLLLLVLLPLVPTLGLVLYTTSDQRQRAIADTKANAMSLARLLAADQEQQIAGTRSVLIALARLPEVRDTRSSTCSTLFTDLLKQYPQYTNIGAATPNGEIFCSGRPFTQLASVVDRPDFQRAMRARDLSIGDFQIGNVSGKPVIMFSYPILNENDQMVGTVFAGLDLGWVNQVLERAPLPPGGTLRLIDQNGTILARYPDPARWVGRTIPQAPVVRTILAEHEGVADDLGPDGIARLYAFTPLRGTPGTDVYVSVGIPASVAFAQVNQTLERNLWVLALVALLASTTAWACGDALFLKKVQSLLTTTGRLAGGDLSARTDLHHGDGELGQLARAFDQMGEALEQRESERRQVEDRVTRRNRQVEGLMEATAEASRQPLDVGKIVDIALHRTASLMDLAGGCVFLERRGTFDCVACYGLSSDLTHTMEWITDPVIQILAQWAHLANTRDVSESMPPWLRPGAAGEPATAISIPISSKGRVLGVMVLVGREHRTLEPHELSMLAAVGQQIGVAIENAELYEQVQSSSTLRERERLSRELHDGLAQVLGYLCIRSAVVADSVAAGQLERAKTQLGQMQTAMQEAYQDVRESILGLRVTVSPNRGLVSTINEYAVKFRQQTGMNVSLITNGAEEFAYAPEVEVQLLRIIQEALANARKHSGARQAWIRFEPGPEAIAVTIQDNGQGFDPAAVGHNGHPSYGLQTMRERAEGLGGSLQIQSEPGQGTRVIFTLCLSKEGHR